MDRMGTYAGQFKDGEFINGKIQYLDGGSYNGYIVDRQKHGVNCEFQYADGDKFVGEFVNDQFKKGVYTTKDGSSYSG